VLLAAAGLGVEEVVVVVVVVRVRVTEESPRAVASKVLLREGLGMMALAADW
jgi:hypothetical protein